MQTDYVRREILTYCASLPQAISARGPAELANVSLTLGNCLCWIAPELDGKAPQIEQVLSQSPQSIFALGRQLQWVGRDWFDRPAKEWDRGAEICLVRHEIARLDKLVHRLAAERGGK
jgi:hypothetical protein